MPHDIVNFGLPGGKLHFDSFAAVFWIHRFLLSLNGHKKVLIFGIRCLFAGVLSGGFDQALTLVKSIFMPDCCVNVFGKLKA
jgi:hypothetical protein